MTSTPAERKKQERERRRAAGQVLVQEWVQREDAKALREFAEFLRLKRAKHEAHNARNNRLPIGSPVD